MNNPQRPALTEEDYGIGKTWKTPLYEAPEKCDRMQSKMNDQPKLSNPPKSTKHD